MAFPTTAPGGGPLVTGTLTLINGVNYIYDATSVTWSPVSTTNSLTLGSLSVNSLTSLSSLDVQGSETVSGNITAQGLISGSNTNYTYGLPTVGATADWIKVGRFTAPQTLTQKGSHCYVKIVTSTGISAVTGQQTEIHIRFSTSNSVAVDANGFGGFTQYYVTNTNTSEYAVKVVSNSAGVSATYYDMWYYQPGIENGFGSFYTVEINESVSNWDHVGITATALNVAAPGAASNTIGDGVNLLALQSNLGIGVTPTAKLHIAAGTTTVAPIKLTSGTNLTTPTAGAMEYDGTSLYFTAASTRKAIAYADGTNITFPTNGTVTTVSVASANGFAGTVSNASTTPAITISTSITGILKGNATAVSAATAGTDYLAPPSGTSILKANNSGALANATAGTDYSAGTSSLTTGILKSTTTTGALSIAAAGTDYQAPLPSQTGNSGKYLTTDGSALSWATVTAGGSMVYPGSGIANSTGSAWGTSYSVSGTGNVVLTTSPQITTSVTTDSTTFSLFNTTATTVNFAGAAETLNVGYVGSATSATFSQNYSNGYVGSGAIKTVNVGTGGAANSTTDVNIGAIAGTLTIGTSNLVGTNTTQNVFNTTATTVNAFGAATSLSIGNNVTTTQTINIGGGATTIGVTKTINIGTNATTAATTNINIGSSTSSAIGTTTIYSNTKISKIAVSAFTGALNNGHLTFTDSFATAGSYSSIDFNSTTITAPHAKISAMQTTRAEGTTAGVKGGHIWIGTNGISNHQVVVTGATFASNVMTLTFATTGVALWSTGGTITVAGLTPTATSGTVVNVNGVFTVLTCTATQVTYTLTSAGTYTRVSGGTVTGFYSGATGVSGAGAAGDGINKFAIFDAQGFLSIGSQVYPTWPITIGNTPAVNVLSFVSNNTTTAYNFGAIANTTGTLYFGVETSTGGGLFTGSAAYSTIVGNRSATSMHLVTNSNIAQTINSSGYITRPLQPSFMARSAYTAGSGPSTPLPGIYIFATVDHNVSSSYNATSGVFTAPVAGKYVFHASCNGRSGVPMFFQLRKNGTAFVYAEDSRGGGGYGQAHADVIINLAANDTVDVYISYAAYGSLNDYFCGHLLG